MKTRFVRLLRKLMPIVLLPQQDCAKRLWRQPIETLGAYIALGIFVLLAARNPSANRSLIAFTAWSSLVHAAITAVQAFYIASERGHLLGGVALFGIIGVALIVLAPAKQSGERASAAGA